MHIMVVPRRYRMKKRIFVAVVVGLAGVTIFMGYVILVGSAIFAADMLNNRDPFDTVGFTATAERAFAASKTVMMDYS